MYAYACSVKGATSIDSIKALIGKPFKGMVASGVAPVQGDYGCVDVDSTTGAASPGGDIKAVDTMTSFAKTVMTAFGGDSGTIDQQITGGSVVKSMLA